MLDAGMIPYTRIDDPRRYEQVGVKQRNHKGTLLIEPGQVIRIVDVVRAVLIDDHDDGWQSP